MLNYALLDLKHLANDVQRGQLDLEFVRGTIKKPQRRTNNVIGIKLTV